MYHFTFFIWPRAQMAASSAQKADHSTIKSYSIKARTCVRIIFLWSLCDVVLGKKRLNWGIRCPLTKMFTMESVYGEVSPSISFLSDFETIRLSQWIFPHRMEIARYTKKTCDSAFKPLLYKVLNICVNFFPPKFTQLSIFTRSVKWVPASVGG